MRNPTQRLLLAEIAVVAMVLLGSFNCKKSTSDDKEIFTDNFNRADSVSIGTNWTTNLPSGTSFGISGTKAQPLGGTATTELGLPVALYTQKVTGSYKLSAKFSISGGTYLSLGYLIGRSTAGDTSSNSYLCGYYYVSGDGSVPDPYVYKFALKKETSGVVTNLGDVPMHALTTGITDTITLTFDGYKITCEMAGNSTISISVVNSSYGDGYIGITGGGNSTPYLFFDDFHAEKL